MTASRRRELLNCKQLVFNVLNKLFKSFLVLSFDSFVVGGQENENECNLFACRLMFA